MTTYNTTQDYLRHIDELRSHYSLDELHMINKMSYMQDKISYEQYTQATYHIEHNKKPRT